MIEPVIRPLAVGDRLPDVALTDERSERWMLRDHVGDDRPALLVFHRHLA